MDVGSGLHSQRDREKRVVAAWTGTRIAVTLLIIAVLSLLAILVVTIASLPPAPASEPELLAPLRWAKSVRWF